jgi:hypothetical protein
MISAQRAAKVFRSVHACPGKSIFEKLTEPRAKTDTPFPAEVLNQWPFGSMNNADPYRRLPFFAWWAILKTRERCSSLCIQAKT